MNGVNPIFFTAYSTMPRCPNGTRKNKNGVCVPTNQNKPAQNKPAQNKPSAEEIYDVLFDAYTQINHYLTEASVGLGTLYDSGKLDSNSKLKKGILKFNLRVKELQDDLTDFMDDYE